MSEQNAEAGAKDSTMTIRDVRMESRRILGECPVESVRATPVLDVDCLLQFVTGKDRSWLLAHDDQLLSQDQQMLFDRLLARRMTGFPIAYLTEEKEFYGYSFYVTPAVLIPKPDTEILVERAVELLSPRIARLPAATGTEQLVIVDMCTGSGCIAISVLLQLYQRFGAEKLKGRVTLYATDISPDALQVASKNAERLIPSEIASCLAFRQGNLWKALGDLHCNALLTNPPYVPAAVTSQLLTDGRSEPRLALDGGDDGLDLIRTQVAAAPAHMAPGSFMLLETGEYNAEEAARLAETAGFTNVTIHRDLAGMLRLTEAHLPD